jgi:hypothetical protein
MHKSFFVLYNYTLYLYLIMKALRHYRHLLNTNRFTMFHYETIYNEVTERMNNMYHWEKAFWYVMHTILYTVIYIALKQYFTW